MLSFIKLKFYIIYVTFHLKLNPIFLDFFFLTSNKSMNQRFIFSFQVFDLYPCLIMKLGLIRVSKKGHMTEIFIMKNK